MNVVQRSVGFVAIAFGLATIVAGGRVLSGADPGYLVFRPLLIFNTAMGLVYVSAGIITLRDIDRGRLAAAALGLVNLAVFAIVVSLFATTDGVVAIDSVRAMAFRALVWVLLYLALERAARAPRR